MRICHIIEAAGGGSGRVALDLVRQGALCGDDITLIYSPVRASPVFISSLATLPASVTVKSICMEKEIGLHDVLAAITVWSYLAHRKPFDILHAHSSKAGGIARVVAAFLPHVKVVYTPHAFVTMGHAISPAMGWLEKGLSFLGNLIVCVSKAEHDHARQVIGIAEEKLRIVLNGIDATRVGHDKAALRRAWGFDQDAIVFGFIGRMAPQKNPSRAIQVFALLANKIPNARFIMIGEGPLACSVKEQAASLGLSSRLVWLDGGDGPTLVPGFDALMCTSDYEAFPLLFLEAMTAGVPILTTPVGGAHELVLPMETGLVAVAFSPEAMVDIGEQYAALDVNVRQAWSDRCREIARAFDLNAMEQGNKRIYKELMKCNN